MGCFSYNPVDLCIHHYLPGSQGLLGRSLGASSGGSEVITRKFVKFAALALAVVGSASLLAKTSAAQAAQEEKDPAAKIKLLDDFVAKFPMSTLLQYIDQLYIQTYFAQKNYPKTI